jgi:DNA-binding NarL/FixJ family response regulator
MSTGPRIRILVVDDHSVVRMGVRGMIRRTHEITIAGEAANGVEAVQAYAKLRPDVVLMDLRMPLEDGVEATREICRLDPTARVLVLSTFDGDEDIHRALEAGAAGYLLKQDSGDDIAAAIRAVARGERWLSPEARRKLAAHASEETITGRETEILDLLARGEANKEIAERLQISENTVKTHLKSILGKLQVRSRTEAVTVALRRGIIQPPERPERLR